MVVVIVLACVVYHRCKHSDNGMAFVFGLNKVQVNLIITLFLGSMETVCVISE